MEHQKPVRHACDRHEAGNHQSASACRDAPRKKISQGRQKPAIDRHGRPRREDGASKDLEETGYKVIGAGSEEREEVSIKDLASQNALRALKDDAFVRLDAGVAAEEKQVEA